MSIMVNRKTYCTWLKSNAFKFILRPNINMTVSKYNSDERRTVKFLYTT